MIKWLNSIDTTVDIQLATFLLLSHLSELSIKAKSKKFWKPSKPVLPNKSLDFFCQQQFNFFL